VPFFLLAGEIMNVGGLSKPHFGKWRSRWWPRQGRARLRGDHRGLPARVLSGSAVADAARSPRCCLAMMVKAVTTRRVPPVCSPPAHHRADHPAVDRPRDLRRGRQRVNHQAVPGRHRAGLLIGARSGTWWWLSRRERIPCAPPQVVRPKMMKGAARIRLGDGAALIILVGLRFGVFTPTEAAVVAAVYALFVATVVYREMKLSQIFSVFVRAAKTASTGACAGSREKNFPLQVP